MKDWFVISALTVAFLLFAALGFWIQVSAPCGWIDWMPAAEVPARCFR